VRYLKIVGESELYSSPVSLQSCLICCRVDGIAV